MRLLALILPLLLALPAAAQTFPPLSGRVVDAANILTPEAEASITARSEALEKATGTQAIVATIPSLQGYPIEDYGYKLGRHWGIGQKDTNNGVILLVAPNDRKVRVEVGYGLEPVLTDALSSVIIQTRLLPKFRAGDMSGGVADGYAAIADQLELPADQAAENVRKAAETGGDAGGIPLGAVFFLLFFLFWIFLAFRSARRGRRRGRRGVGPVVIWGPGLGGGWGGGGGGWGGGGGGFGGGGGGFGGGGASGGW